MVHGTVADVEKAKTIIEDTHPSKVTLHSEELVGATAR